jgi:predicted dehydrogenase
MMNNTKYLKPLRWGIIGCGAVTEVKSGPPYQQTQDFQLIAVMRRDVKKAEDYARRHGVPKFYSKAEDLIADPEVDAVYIATPPDTHKHYALMVAGAGKPCCVEKPMAPSYADSLEIFNVFKERNLPLFVAYYRRSLPRFLKIKEWLDNDEIGQVRHIRWHLTKPPSTEDLQKTYNWRTVGEVAPGGYFDDLASHGLDLFSFYLGDVAHAFGVSTNQQKLYTAKDAIAACWIYKNGVTGEGSWNFGAAAREDKVEIIGSKGKIIFSVFNEEDITLTNGNGTTNLFVAHPKHVQQFHVENLREHLLEHREHPSTGRSGLHTSWIMDRILGHI